MKAQKDCPGPRSFSAVIDIPAIDGGRRGADPRL